MNEADHAWTLHISDAGAAIAQLATTPIASHEPGGLQQLGMGTLFEIGASRFLVTAGHVVKESQKNDWPLSVFDAAAEDSPVQPVTLLGNACRIDEEAYDVALIELHQPVIEELPRRQFLHLQDVEIGTLQPGFFCIFGYARNMAKCYVNGSEFYLEPFAYGGPLFRGETRAFGGYDRRHHILIERSELGVIGRDGEPGALPEDLSGISGCPVFQVWRSGIARSEWASDQIRIVGVLTGGHREAFVVTRWGHVIDLLWRAFPGLRPIMQLNGRTPRDVTGPAVSAN